jgi:hypothetical protein
VIREQLVKTASKTNLTVVYSLWDIPRKMTVVQLKRTVDNRIDELQKLNLSEISGRLMERGVEVAGYIKREFLEVVGMIDFQKIFDTIMVGLKYLKDKVGYVIMELIAVLKLIPSLLGGKKEVVDLTPVDAYIEETNEYSQYLINGESELRFKDVPERPVFQGRTVNTTMFEYEKNIAEMDPPCGPKKKGASRHSVPSEPWTCKSAFPAWQKYKHDDFELVKNKRTISLFADDSSYLASLRGVKEEKVHNAIENAIR